ncbi:MAG: hypothetical protein QUT30_05605 [Acidobacteriota bacterium]|nr:hypothetical protein [Acidobacteriota bacterium]
MTTRTEIANYRKENRLLKKQIEERTGKTVDQLYAERAKRVKDTIELRTPDRVPFMVLVEAHRYAGIPNSAAYYDPITLKRAMRKMAVDLEPDMSEPGFPACGAAMTELDVQNCVWPGGPKPPDYEYQFIEGEYMKEEEYDLFLNDPSGFMLRCYLPRVYRALMPLAKLPPLDSMFMGLESITPLFASPEFQKMARHLARAGKQVQKFYKIVGDAHEELAQLGFPPFARFAAGGVGGAPFDTVTSFLRGMKGSMLDMYRRPDKLLRACEVILERRIASAFPADPASKDYPPRVGLPLWRGDPVFMSDAQFKKFYWPGLKKSLQTHVDLGYVPVPFFEAVFGDRLECLLELPKGKILVSIEAADAVRAKEILGGHSALLVRCPNTCKLWSLGQLESFIKNLIDKCGGNGGLILVIKMPDAVQIEEMQAMLQSIKEYGRY